MEDNFVEEHRREIEKEANRIYRERIFYRQEDNPMANFLQAISNVKRRYDIDGLDRRK
jgi:hypothetical protein